MATTSDHSVRMKLFCSHGVRDCTDYHCSTAIINYASTRILVILKHLEKLDLLATNAAFKNEEIK